MFMLCAACVVCWPGSAAAARKMVLAIGSNSGLEHEEALSFGTADAAAFAALMAELGGVNPRDVHLLLNPSKPAFEAALNTALQLVDGETTFVFYYSGHGNDTHLHVAGQSIDRDWLKSKLGGAPARLRLMFVDACRGLKERGLAPAEAFEVRHIEYSGLVLIQSASRGEIAFESGQLQGGLFTRHLLSGLRGPADNDGDGRVSLDEAYTFAHGHTLVDSGATQVPDREIAITGSGALELTTVIETESRLRLPREQPARYTIFRQGWRTVFAEAWSNRESQVEIALPAASFIVWRRGEVSSTMAAVTTRLDGGLDLVADDFVPVDTGDMKERGGTVSPLPQHRLALTAGFVFSPEVDGATGIGQSVALDYAWLRGENGWAPSIGLTLYREAFDMAAYDAERSSIQLFAGVLTPSLSWGSIQLQAGVGLTGTLTVQDKSGEPGDDDAGPFERLGALAQLSLRVPIAQRIDWVLALAVNPTWFRELDEPPTEPGQTRGSHVGSSTAMFSTTGLSVGF
jgi:hypothetical protein